MPPVGLEPWFYRQKFGSGAKLCISEMGRSEMQLLCFCLVLLYELLPRDRDSESETGPFPEQWQWLAITNSFGPLECKGVNGGWVFLTLFCHASSPTISLQRLELGCDEGRGGQKRIQAVCMIKPSSWSYRKHFLWFVSCKALRWKGQLQSRHLLLSLWKMIIDLLATPWHYVGLHSNYFCNYFYITLLAVIFRESQK